MEDKIYDMNKPKQFTNPLFNMVEEEVYYLAELTTFTATKKDGSKVIKKGYSYKNRDTNEVALVPDRPGFMLIYELQGTFFEYEYEKEISQRKVFETIAIPGQFVPNSALYKRAFSLKGRPLEFEEASNLKKTLEGTKCKIMFIKKTWKNEDGTDGQRIDIKDISIKNLDKIKPVDKKSESTQKPVELKEEKKVVDPLDDVYAGLGE